MSVKQYRKKPVVIEALLWNGDNLRDVEEFFGITNPAPEDTYSNGKIPIDTLEGTMTASKGDYIIKGVQGEFYPCKPDIFESTYEEVKL